jgi:hypothetical protein
MKALSARDLIAQVAPTGFRQNNASLFKLGRLVRSCENTIDRQATMAELQFAFDSWCQYSRPFWRDTREDYWAEFLEAYHYARFGVHDDPIQVAYSRARAVPLPVVAGFTDERGRLLAAICGEMHRMLGGNSFFCLPES